MHELAAFLHFSTSSNGFQLERAGWLEDGRIVLGEEGNALREQLKKLLAEGKKKVVLDVGKITFIDSAGLGVLVSSHHTANKEGASLRLCHLDHKFEQVLQITKLLTVFYISNTEAEAVASFSNQGHSAVPLRLEPGSAHTECYHVFDGGLDEDSSGGDRRAFKQGQIH